ncbi:hypothetical protein BH10ACI1_BH10ACI1_02070 [soil metagenome]
MNIDQIDKCIEELIHIIEVEKGTISNKRLVEICSKIGNITSGEINPHFYHELIETALNALIKRKYSRPLLNSHNPVKELKEILTPMTEKLPTQTWRSNEQIKWQQFSTPPGIAYLLAYLLNFKTGQQVLEPSAGTGNLAIWSSGFGLTTYTNEIDFRRRELLFKLGLMPTAFNAEFIHDFLPNEIEPDCILMNPPFSANGGRTANNSSKFGFRHVESALERLKNGGKFGIILGNSAGLDTRTGKQFWQKLSNRIRIKAIIKIAGREYSKNGTRVDVNVIIGTKYQTQENGCKWSKNAIKSISVRSVEEAFALTQELNLRLD